MYLKHFGLLEYPFSLTPDTSFIVATSAHQAALNTLLVALESGEGFIKITGEVGSGKSLLCRRFLNIAQQRGAVTAYIANPQLEPRTILLAVASELGIKLIHDDYQFNLLNALNAALLEHARTRRRVIVCIDEAQAIPLETLEHLRLLSNLETEKTKLLHVVMFGQPELDEHLSHVSVRQLRQRISFEFNLHGLTRSEAHDYIAHRARVAGFQGEAPLFSRVAARRLHKASRGVPRVINILAHKSLLAAFGSGAKQVGGAHVLSAARDSEAIASRIGWWS